MTPLTQSDINTAKQNHRELYYRVNILNYKMQIVDEIGDVVTDATFTIDSTSNIRRTATLDITPDKDEWYKIEYGSKLWGDKYIQIYIGIKDDLTQEVNYTNMGIYLINNPSQRYESTDKTITLQLVDLMAKMTGMRNGYLASGADYQIPKGSNIRDTMIAILAECGFTNYNIEFEVDAYTETQIEITVSATSTYYDILEQLNQFNINYEMYFDTDGVFHYHKIPDAYSNMQVMVDDSVWESTYISHELTNDYESIKNKIVVIGMTHDVSYYSTTTTFSNNVYQLTIADLSELDDGIVIGFTPTQVPNPNTAFRLQINSLGVYDVIDDLGNVPNLIANTYYVIYWDATQLKWIFEGEVTARGIAQEDDIQSPYCVYGTLGEIGITLQGGEYDNISSDNLAQQRAEWELYTRCKLRNSLSLTCVPIYWLDVNWVISITLPNETQPQFYIIKQISTDGTFDSTQRITLMKFYPYYEY